GGGLGGGGGVVGREELPVGVVVEKVVLWPPADGEGELRPEADPGRDPQVLRPAPGRSEDMPGPVEGADERAHLASAAQEGTGVHGKVHDQGHPTSRRRAGSTEAGLLAMT